MVVGSTWKDFDDKSNWGVSVCTSGARPTAYEGRLIYETDTDKVMKCTNAVGPVWAEIGGGIADHSLLANLAWSVAGHTIDATIDMNNNSITDINELWFNASDPGIKFDTGDFIWFDTSQNEIFFEIASDNICSVTATGLFPDNDDTYYLGSGSGYWKGIYGSDIVVEAGTYMTGDGAGNMEFHVASGKVVKIVVG